MQKADVLDKLRREWTRWEALTAGADEEFATRPGLAGEWSLKDVVAHLTRYERWNAAGLGGAPFELPPPPPGLNLDDMDARNNWFRELDRDLNWRAVQSASRAAHTEFETLIAALPEAELHANYTIDERGQLMRAPADAAESWPLWQIIDGDAGAHYEAHANELEAWLKKGA
jgi:hypothetical protein